MTAVLKKTLAALAVSGALLAPQAQAGGSLDLSLSNDAFRFAWDATQSNSGMHLNLAWLHHEEEGDMLEAGVHVVDVRPSTRNLYIGIGAKLHLVDTDWFDAGGVGVGGFFRYAIPANRDVSVAGYAYYAPPVLSFSDAENMINTDVRLQYSMIPTARLFVGYRYVGIRLEGASKRYELGDGLHAGLTIDF